jgi:D-cysteine desulfhydrase/L-cysteate sulfo-lyase
MSLSNPATALVSSYPRVELGHFPTPLERMANLGADFGIDNLWVKREDCSGLAFGGNKVRPLEFYLGAAAAAKADTVMITGAVQSNFMRTTAAAAAKLGLDCHVQLEDRVSDTDEIYQRSGNVLLDRIFGAKFHHFPEGEDEVAADRQVNKLAAELSAAGRRPFVIPLAADQPPLGALGYVLCAGEILAQAARDGIDFDHVVVASGSGLTHGGLLVGFRALGRDDIRVQAMCVRRDADSQRQRMRRRAAMIADLIGHDSLIDEADLLINDRCFPPSYGKLNGATQAAIAAFARREGLLLDPVYSGKVAAGMMHMAAAGDFAHAKGVIFIHTGGQPALFAYEPALTTAYTKMDNGS